MDKEKLSISPAEIKNCQFDRKMRGYDPEQVDGVLQLAADSLEQAIVDIDQLEKEIGSLRNEITDYKKMESTIKDTMVSTQGSADEIRKSAEKEAELIMREARLKAAEESEEAERRVAALKGDIERLRSMKSEYIIKLRSLLSTHQEMLVEVAKDDSPEPRESEASEEY